MDRKEIAQAIRKELKTIGISAKQVSVKSSKALYDDAIDIAIKDITINKEKVEEIANKYEYIRYDKYNGEILSGGNTYVNVSFDYIALLDARKDFMEKATEIYEEGKKCEKSSNICVYDKDDISVLYSYENRSIGIFKKPSDWKETGCFCYESIKRLNAGCVGSISEALVNFKYQYGINF